jgi:2-polyprenyl-3-methyl-5-hydroxy-6-metoxy-1,4-benzoquinol methylase
MPLIDTVCDLCESTDFVTRYPSTIAPVSADPTKYYSSSRFKAAHSKIVQCHKCGLVRTNPRDDDQTLEKIYASLEDFVYEQEEQNRRSTTKDHFALVQKYSQGGARLLDIGCSTGIFLQIAASRGWQISGLEPSSWAVERARERCPEGRIIHGSLEKADLPQSSFDVITLWDVLEHVPSPKESLHKITEWLVPGGWLFLNVPNIDSFMARLTGHHWPLLLREHLWYFSPATIEALLNLTGFELVKVRPNFVKFSISNILTRIAQYSRANSEIVTKINSNKIFRSVSVKFPMGEMNVIAKKRDF